MVARSRGLGAHRTVVPEAPVAPAAHARRLSIATTPEEPPREPAVPPSPSIAAPVDPAEPKADEQSSAAAPPLARRAWIAWCVFVVVALVSLRLVAPSILAWWAVERISATLGVPARIEDVDMSLLAGEITVEGIHAAPAADASASALHIDAFTVSWSWLELTRGIAMVDGRMSGVEVTIDAHRPWAAVRERVSARPPRLRSLVIEDGTLRVVQVPDTAPIVALTDIHGSLRAIWPPTETKTTHFSVDAKTPGGGTFTLEGSMAPADPAASWTLRFDVERLDLRTLNPLFETVFEMDVEHGWLSLHGWLTVGFGRLRGQIRPRFEELQLLGRGERRVRHPMAEALFSSLLSGADLPIDIDRSTASTGEPASEPLADVDAMELLRDIILRGFIRRLNTLDGYETTAERAEVDFPAGRLSFFDITLTRKGGAVGRPFITIARLDIVIEPTAVDRDSVTYKAITLHQPSMTFVTGDSAETSQLTFDPQWQDKVNVLPYPTDLVEIFDGRVEYRDDTTDPPTSLVVSDLDLRVDDLGRARVEGGRRGATLTGRAKVMDLSELDLALQFTPGVVDLDAAIEFHLEPLPLPELNQLIEGRLGVDVSSGTLALDADLDVHDNRLHGTITPALDGVRVLGLDEERVIHPVRELMLERRLRKLDGTTLWLDHRVRTSVIRELPAALMSAVRRARKAEPKPVLQPV